MLSIDMVNSNNIVAPKLYSLDELAQLFGISNITYNPDDQELMSLRTHENQSEKHEIQSENNENTDPNIVCMKNSP